MVVQIGLEHLTSCKYPHVCADCGAKNALCGLEENRLYGYPAQKITETKFYWIVPVSAKYYYLLVIYRLIYCR